MADEFLQVRAIVQSLERVTERAIVKITLDVTANLIETTPVDTGWARANWVPKIGETDDQPVGNPGDAGVAAAAQASGQASIPSYRLEQGKITIANNVPYVPILNDGHSSQAAAGFVQRAIQKAVTVDFLGFEG